MTTPNHLMGGAVFTGFWASIMGLNIFSNPAFLIITFIGSIFPDIDHRRSIIGRLFPPVSKWINTRYGHRTITHSAFCWIGLSVIYSLIELAIFGSRPTTFFFSCAYLSHLIFDMMTKQGIGLFYPYKKNPAVLPADPRMRFETGNFRQETMIFFGFTAFLIFLYPLFDNGFWTSYNRMFGTAAHLQSEYNKSDKLMEVTYKLKKGTEHFEGKGYCVAASENEVVLIDKIDEDFFIINSKEYQIQEVIGYKTDKVLEFDNLAFVDVPLDSLFSLQNRYISKIDLVANRDFVYLDGAEKFEVRKLKKRYLNGLQLFDGVSEIEQEQFKYQANPKVQILNNKLEKLESKKKLMDSEFVLHNNRLSSLKSDVSSESDLVKKQQKMEELRELEKRKFKLISESEIQSLRVEIKALKREEYSNNEAQKFKVQQSNKSNQITQLKFSGYVEYITF